MDNPSDPNQSISRDFSFLTKVKYGGVLGKITAIAASFFITLCFLTVASVHYPYLLGGIALIALVSAVFFIAQVKAIYLADPKMATLEGEEVIRFLEIELKSRNRSAFHATELEDIPDQLSNNRYHGLRANFESGSLEKRPTEAVPHGEE